MDVSTAVWIGVGFILTLVVGLIGGRFLDPEWKVKQLRYFTKKNYIIVGLVSEDKRTIVDRSILVEGGVVFFAGKIWQYEEGGMYRKDKPEQVINIKSNLKWKEGVPYIFLSEKTFRPIDFAVEKTDVKPQESGSILTAWLANQYAKMMASVRRNEMIILATLIAVILIGGGLYVMNGTIVAAKQSSSAAQVAAEACLNETKRIEQHFGIIRYDVNGTLIVQG